jgi:hypothetical protein
VVQIHSPRPLQPFALIKFTQHLLRQLKQLCCGTMEQLKSPTLLRVPLTPVLFVFTELCGGSVKVRACPSHSEMRFSGTCALRSTAARYRRKAWNPTRLGVSAQANQQGCWLQGL